MNANRDRQPPWTRDELILALELYFRDPGARGNARHPETIRLSQELNSLAIHAHPNRGSVFRNPSGIGLELMNFTRFDAVYQARGRRGMTHGSKLQKEIWNTFSSDLRYLSRTATAIRDIGLAGPVPSGTHDADILDVTEAPEGRILTRVHRLPERNSRVVAAKKADTIKHRGRLECEVCMFDFEAVYGVLGKRFAECHHIVALSALDSSRTTRLNDLLIVCANCHRMMHRSRPWTTAEQLRSLINGTKSQDRHL